jgi:sugar phosphate isomerase/epimerase
MNRRALGTMIAYGFPNVDLEVDLGVAARLKAKVLEILPDWRNLPDPITLRNRLSHTDLTIHSVHGCWGGQAINAYRVDLADPDRANRLAALDDQRRSLDWLDVVGGRCVVVHPGGLSHPGDALDRRQALGESLLALADQASGGQLTVCVENMPPGVFPGSQMAELRTLLEELARPELGLALDTGHANLSATPAAATLQAGPLLRTTHVHDNHGKLDSHDPPGTGTIEWPNWIDALKAIAYEGPIILECIRHLRNNPESLSPQLMELLDRLCGGDDLGKEFGS